MRIALAAFALIALSAEAQTAGASQPELFGTWSCSTGFTVDGSSTRVLSETVFEPSGEQAITGSILWTSGESAVRASFGSVSRFTLQNGILSVDLLSLDVEVTDVRGPLANIPDANLVLQDGIEADAKKSAQTVSDIVELTHERLVTKARDNGTLGTCVRKG